MLLLKVLLFQTTKKSIKNVAVAVAAAAAAVFWGFYKKCLLSSFPYGIHCLKSYVQYCKHGLVCDPCDFEMILLLWRQLLANSQWSVHVCLCVPLWLVFLCSLCLCLPGCLVAWLLCLLAAWLAGWLGLLARLLACLFAGCLAAWLGGWLVGLLLGCLAGRLLASIAASLCIFLNDSGSVCLGCLCAYAWATNLAVEI